MDAVVLSKNGNKTRKNRRAFKRNKVNKNQMIKLVGVNSAGISSKYPSFKTMLNKLNPSIWFLQETKLKTPGRIKTGTSNQYEIFELLRKNTGGGGLAVGVLNCLNPVLVYEGNDELELMVIEINIDGTKIRIINAYGPQEKQKVELKQKFWEKLDDEVSCAENLECGLILQMDGNLRAGPSIIPGDPNTQNKNGKLFANFLENHPNLSVVNALPKCEGLITRRRQTVNGVEEAVLDYFVVCDRILPFVNWMLIDEKQENSLTNYCTRNKAKKAIDSDHFTLSMELGLKFHKNRNKRVEHFNFRNKECQEEFRKMTTNTSKLSEQFLSDSSLQTQVKSWEKNLNSIFHQTFRKIRVNKPIKKDKISELIEKRNNLKKNLAEIKKAGDDDETTQNALNDVEKVISDSCAEDNLKLVVENFGHLSSTDGSVNSNGIWKLKKRIFPKHSKSLPVCKKDAKGKIVSNPEELKSLYLQTYKHRLRHRPIAQDLRGLKNLKETLFKKRLRLSKLRKSSKWNKKDLETVLKKLKNNKSRDPHGMVNEIFKPGVIGKDLQDSLLLLVNRIKDTVEIPKIMEYANITSIYKGKGEKVDLENDRGIFIVSVLRSIFMKLLYNDNYDILEQNMSDSNIGARKGKSVRNHIFIVNGVIHDVLANKKANPIDNEVLDYKQCFDSLWLEECMNDLFEGGIDDDNLALIYEANRNINVAVNTPNGLTARDNIEKIVLQGDVFGPLECSVTVDTFGKECMDEEKHLYMYKEEVGIPPLAMIDDLISVSKCGIESVKTNTFLNAKSSLKKLQFGMSKCHKLHVGQHKSTCPDLYLDEWRVKTVDETETVTQQDVQEDEHVVEEVSDEKYLGDIISKDGKNSKNIKARVAKALGSIKQIMEILENICFGPYQFQVALVLRNALLLSSLMFNSEAWYNVTDSDITELEKVDEKLLRKVLECPESTPREMLYLELGCLPLRFILMSRRIMFLQTILQEDKSSLLHRFFKAQLNHPTKGDWCQSVKKNIEDLKLDLNFNQIEHMKKEDLQKIIKDACKISALEYLNKVKSKHSKVLHIPHSTLDMQPYLKPNHITIMEAKFIFSVRTRMLDVKTNFKNKYNDLKCPNCMEEDSQSHLLSCDKIVSQSEIVTEIPKYENIFGTNLDEILKVTRILSKNFKERNKLKSQEVNHVNQIVV